MDRETFNSAVYRHLWEIGRSDVAGMARRYERGIDSLGPCDVAREEDVARTAEAVEIVAEAYVNWKDEHHDPARRGALLVARGGK